MIPLTVPNLSQKESENLKECIRSNFVSYLGPFVVQLEQMVAEGAGARRGVATSSGTTGLHLALTTMGVVRDDLVILPSLTFIASANAIAHCGAMPWLLDVDDESWTLDPEVLADCLKHETHREKGRVIHTATGRQVRAIMPVYTLGLPADMDSIMDIASHYGLAVVADGAAALGATYKSRGVGQLADLTVFSFNGNKTITSGGGGMITGKNDALLNDARHLSTTARLPGTEYDHDRIGFNYRMTNLQAAVGCGQMERFKELLGAKERIRDVYVSGFSAFQGVRPFPSPSWAKSACWISGVTIERDTPAVKWLCDELTQERIEARPFWKPIHLQVPYEVAPRSTLAVTEKLWHRILTLPSSSNLTGEEQQVVIDAVKRVLNRSWSEVEIGNQHE